jgi:predicted nucleotidyltransferase component of viral defense system
MTTDLEKSLKAKLRAVALETKRDPADLWQQLMLERFLVRLSRSPYRTRFILKGGILLTKYIDIGRETRDLDFLGRGMNNEVLALKSIFEEIIEIDLNDGFVFQDVVVNELIHTHMGYSGAEVSMNALFGRTRFKISIDVGFGDLVDPIEKLISLTSYSKGALFESSIELSCYPKEFIFAEKLETIIHRGSINSRMKDFHDLYSLMSSSISLPFHNLEKVVHSVFEHRKTPLILPITYSEEGLLQLQGYWNAYLKNLRVDDSQHLPTAIKHLLNETNNWLSTQISLGTAVT